MDASRDASLSDASVMRDDSGGLDAGADVETGVVDAAVSDSGPRIDPVEGELKAFPSAYGAGAYASGGRGGSVYHVTNLRDDGSPGSLRWAVAQPRPAIIVFDVSGVINLSSTLELGGRWNQTDDRDDNLTIAGQSAPVGGITITSDNPNARVTLYDVRNVIVRYIRIRLQRDNNVVALAITGDWHPANNIIVDHCSVSYGGWAAFAMRGVETHHVSVQNCLFAESKTGAIFGDSDVEENSYDNSFNGNFFYNVSHRFPNPNSIGRVDVINNVVQNPTFRQDSNTFAPLLNHINNYTAAGNWMSMGFSRMNRDFDRQRGHIYTAGNVIDNGIFEDASADNRLMWSKWAAGSETAYLPDPNFADRMHPLLGAAYPILSAREAYANVIENQDKGASWSLNSDGSVSDSRDANDRAYFAQTAEGEGAYEPYTTGNSGAERSFFGERRYLDFIDSVSETPINRRPDTYDTDHDGMADEWERAAFGNLSRDGTGDADEDGYTDVEEFLNMVDYR